MFFNHYGLLPLVDSLVRRSRSRVCGRPGPCYIVPALPPKTSAPLALLQAHFFMGFLCTMVAGARGFYLVLSCGQVPLTFEESLVGIHYLAFNFNVLLSTLASL